MTTIDFIKRALENSISDNCIIPAAVNNYVDIFATDRRYKLKWLAADCYKNGCSSGIIQYHGCEYYFYMSAGILHVKYN